MPLRKPEDFGTDWSGYHVNDFCRHCYDRGSFTEPSITIEAMLERCVSGMCQHGIMPEPKARALMIDTLPRLKRWRTRAGVAE